ncbi:MAG: DUF5107 domain-containing protein [Cellulosilyticaceae bacterium]
MIQSTLKLDTMKVKVSPWQQSATVPFLSSLSIMQNHLVRDLDGADPLDVGYGTIGTYYPYTQQNLYSRALSETDVEIAVLENAFLKAIFVPSLGGKLWSLYDKEAEKELLYVNDVMRPSNLAVRNAWMSGGVEWNIGVIGHSPFTCEQLFMGSLDVEGMPVLRFYEYERIRKVTYQMDFFLPEESHYLYCRMQIQNANTVEVPMYWWSNIAVPKIENGRLVVGADEAYTSSAGRVYKVAVPKVADVDISYPAQIPHIVDYFFDLPKTQRKFITQVDGEGYGMIQTSTSRLEGRKLFVWGNKPGSERWQRYLTEEAGPYVEIQAGLAKTQYGCLPMPPSSEWEWIEAYGAINIPKTQQQNDWNILKKEVGDTLERQLPEQFLEELLVETKQTIGHKACTVLKKGSGFGAIENLRRSLCGEQPLCTHLDFGEAKGCWRHLLEEGTLGEQAVHKAPESYMLDRHYKQLLEAAIKNKDQKNWLSWYHLGTMQLVDGDVEGAIRSLEYALCLQESAFILHSLAFAYYRENEQFRCIEASVRALGLRSDDLGLVKDLFGLLLQCEAYKELEKVSEALPEVIQSNTRVKACRIVALTHLNQKEAAKALLYDGNYLEVEDIREGDCITGELWGLLEPEAPLPMALDFNAGF